MDMTDIRAPTAPAFGPRASIGRWFKRPGDGVTSGEPLVEIEADSRTLEVHASVTGVLSKRLLDDGQSVRPGDLLGIIATY
jgi:2-oxoglutarate dehydrogenase E2 component (dihydrolipoamide succinyltransferase)